LLLTRKKKPPPKMMTKISTVVTKRPIPPPAIDSVKTSKPVGKQINGTKQKDAALRKSSTPVSSRPSSKEPVERIRQERSRPNKRASPTISTPHFTSDDDDEPEQPRKRARIEEVVDPGRRIRDADAFNEDSPSSMPRVHAYDIANETLETNGHFAFTAFFDTLAADEDDENKPIHIEYPGVVAEPERYQLVKPTDQSDFKPITEIFETMKIVSEYYLDEVTAEKVYCEEDGSGLYQKLKRPLFAAEKHRTGAQKAFVDIVQQYNRLIRARRADGTIAKAIDSMPKIPLKLVEHIIKNQVYSRTVSPSVHLVRHYESFSDNVYGELLPMFLSRIFKLPWRLAVKHGDAK
jgi:[histone H3]-lysine79 N-trimethyltransferase